jgi:hypothetical protein
MHKKDALIANQNMSNFMAKRNYINSVSAVNFVTKLLFGKNQATLIIDNNTGLRYGSMKASALDNCQSYQATVIPSLKQLSSIGLKKNLSNN